MSRTLMIMAGGTGGHIYPAMSVADYMREQGWQIVWLGSQAGMEARIVPPKGYAMVWIRFSGVRGKGLLRAVMLPFNLLIACWQSARAIFAHRPEVVLGMGGYVAFPGGLMAALLRRPLVIHEQNSVAGLTNRVLARFADRVLTAFPNSFKYNKLSQWVGNPTRADIGGVEAPDARYAGRGAKLNVMVLGGSQGAAVLNDTLPKALALMPEGQRPQVTHQSGAAHIDALRAAYAAAGVQAETLPFIDDMAMRYAAADLIICRAGASTVTEIAAVGVASILVPLPWAVDDHQTANARYLSDRGAAILIPQAEFKSERLAQLLQSFARDKLLEMARAARTAAKPDATREVGDICRALAHAA
ncbi:MAG TPA: undecaprenyldiphospho-muramoylpentapeptide beta-N-acetylglucosaminyltransferase [Burkholderiales bacterium]|nr:undecaprenyldiphospho-muramoylpentapeptide beta-N-acetylglucosaminyltransferase [Burkholderiales bacterium]